MNVKLPCSVAIVSQYQLSVDFKLQELHRLTASLALEQQAVPMRAKSVSLFGIDVSAVLTKFDVNHWPCEKSDEGKTRPERQT